MTITAFTDDLCRLFFSQLDALGLRKTVSATGRKGRFQCPGHGADNDLSAAWELVDDGRKLLVHCHARCNFKEIAAKLNMPEAMFFGSRPKGDDRAQRKRDALALHRVQDLAAHDALVRQLLEHCGWPLWALSAVGAGLHSPGRIAFPYRDAMGHVIGTTAWVAPHLRGWIDAPSKIMDAGSRHGLLYPVAGITADPVAIVEGGAAAVAALVCGYQPIAVSSASFVPPPSWARLVRDRHVVVLPDADTPGRAAADRLAAWALAGSAASVTNVDLLPDHHHGEDVADLLRIEGRAATVEIVHGAIEKADRAVPTVNRGGRPSRESGAAEAWLLDLLGDGQWVRSRDLAAKRPQGLSDRTVERARRKLDIESQQFHREWWVRKKATK